MRSPTPPTTLSPAFLLGGNTVIQLLHDGVHLPGEAVHGGGHLGLLDAGAGLGARTTGC